MCTVAELGWMHALGQWKEHSVMFSHARAPVGREVSSPKVEYWLTLLTLTGRTFVTHGRVDCIQLDMNLIMKKTADTMQCAFLLYAHDNRTLNEWLEGSLMWPEANLNYLCQYDCWISSQHGHKQANVLLLLNVLHCRMYNSNWMVPLLCRVNK